LADAEDGERQAAIDQQSLGLLVEDAEQFVRRLVVFPPALALGHLGRDLHEQPDTLADDVRHFHPPRHEPPEQIGQSVHSAHDHANLRFGRGSSNHKAAAR